VGFPCSGEGEKSEKPNFRSPRPKERTIQSAATTVKRGRRRGKKEACHVDTAFDKKEKSDPTRILGESPICLRAKIQSRKGGRRHFRGEKKKKSQAKYVDALPTAGEGKVIGRGKK